MKKSKIYSIGAVLIIIDQFIKLLITSNMRVNQIITVLPNFFSIYYVKNTGAAFSIFRDKVYLFIIIGLIALFFLDKYISITKTKKLEGISLGLVIGGIVGNLLDRLLFGYVIDYLSFDILKYSFPVFNVADMAIVVGAVLLVIDLIRGEINERKRKNS